MGICHLKIKGSVVPIHTMKIYGGVEVQLYAVLTLALGEGSVVSFTSHSLCCWRKPSHFSLKRWTSVSQSWLGHWRSEKSSVPARNQTLVPQVSSL